VRGVRTVRQRRGSFAEEVAAAWVVNSGWQVVARNVKVGLRDEIDIVAVDPGPPAELVCVEVRSARSSRFGSPEERVDRDKVISLYRAMRALQLDIRLPRRVDLLVVDLRATRPEIRHLPRLEPA
jgi:putative endonuclease